MIPSKVVSSLISMGFKSLTLLHQEAMGGAQGRVRRLIGRRRGGGMDRYIGVLSREVGQAAVQDNVDPITELLTQLSGKDENVCSCTCTVHLFLLNFGHFQWR